MLPQKIVARRRASCYAMLFNADEERARATLSSDVAMLRDLKRAKHARSER
jgi:hypothetical protein